MSTPTTQSHPSDIQQLILHLLKQRAALTIAQIAAALDISYEAVRLQVGQMERDGWIAGRLVRPVSRSAGRPTTHYALTLAGEHLFPKGYDLLAIKLLDTIGERLGSETLDVLLRTLTDEVVAKWAPVVEGRSLRERLELLKDLYEEHDSYMQVEDGPDGLKLIERNCPYLNVASRHTALCSTSVSALMRLLGVRVERAERFQNGDRRCVFRVLVDQPIDPASITFQLESDVPASGGRAS